LIWEKFVSSNSVAGAVVIGQITLLLLLIPRFWQRGIAVSYWQKHMLVPVVAVRPIEPAPVIVAPAPVVPEPSPDVVNPAIPPLGEPQ
jgi:hypothetical protein